MRKAPPALWTPPSRMLSTPSSLPISGMLFVVPRYSSTEVREITFRDRILESCVSRSSCTPSVKPWVSGSPLVFRNGRTAIEVLWSPSAGEPDAAGGASAEDEAGPRLERAIQPPAIRAAVPASARIPDGQRRPRGAETIWVISPGSASDVRRIPSGPVSKAHAMTSAMGNPSRQTSAMPRTTASGSSIAGTRISATCRTPKHTAPYTAATLNTFRRLSSANRRW